TAGIIRVGRSLAGSIGVGAQITPAGTNQLELVTGGAIIDNNGTNPDITVSKLALTAVAGVVRGTESAPLDVRVDNLEATTTTGGISVTSDTAFTVGGVNGTLSGVTAAGGDIFLQVSNGTLTVGATATEGVSDTGGGSIVIQTTGAGTDITVNAPV